MSNYKCPQCHSDFMSGTKFCQSCGYNLQSEFLENPVCPKCHKEHPAGTKFCDVDGTRLASSEPLIRKCVICQTTYMDDTKFCPKDGGAVVSDSSIYIQNGSTQLLNKRYAKADLGKRFVASLIDSLVMMALALPASIFYFMSLTNASENDASGAIAMFLISGVLCLIPLAYGLVKDGMEQGQSVGKRSMGLMVVYLPDQSPCTIGQSFVRNILMVLLNIIPLIGWLVEPIMVLSAEGSRRIGDKAANTQVIERNEF